MTVSDLDAARKRRLERDRDVARGLAVAAGHPSAAGLLASFGERVALARVIVEDADRDPTPPTGMVRP